MATLTIAFDGMSLIVRALDRCEALFIDTNKVQSARNHQHEHVLKIGGDQIQLNHALAWVEQRGQRLKGEVVNMGRFVAGLDEIAPDRRLVPALATDHPESDDTWQDMLAAWVRLPAGTLTTAPTATIGGNVGWEFRDPNGGPVVTRHLTETLFLTTPDITGPLRLAVKSPPSGTVKYYNIEPEPGGDFLIRLSTKYVGTPSRMPVAGETVELHEMELLYACLKPGTQAIPVPSTVWPSTAFQGPSQVLTTDPETGICPPGIISATRR